MRALYSLISRARTFCALTQALVTLTRHGWAALAPTQVLLVGCGLCIIVRMLVPSPASGHKAGVLMDFLCSLLAVAALIALAVSDAVGSCILLGRLALGV